LLPTYQYKPEAQAKVKLILSFVILCETVEAGTRASEANCPLPAEEGWVMEKKEKREKRKKKEKNKSSLKPICT
jgi:hypothetical protein